MDARTLATPFISRLPSRFRRRFASPARGRLIAPLLAVLVVFGIVPSACVSTQPTIDEVVSSEPAQPIDPDARVVVLSLDGAQALMLHRYYGEGLFGSDGFARFFEEGEVAEAMVPVNPTLTAPSHLSLITGVDPSETGIVSNRFRPAGAGPGGAVSGFTAPIGAETLWQSAMARGLPVGIVTYPGADNESPERRGDWGMAWNGRAEQRPRVVDLEPAQWMLSDDGRSSLQAAGVETFAAPRWAEVDIVDRRDDEQGELVRFWAVDTSNDDRAAYDALWIAPADEPGILVREGQWAQLSNGRSIKVLRLAPDALSTSRVYFDGRWVNLAYGGTYSQELVRRELQWPGPPDDDLLDPARETEADLATFQEQAVRFAQYFGDALVAGIESQDWRLLIGYIPVIDEVLHALPPGSEVDNAAIAAVQRIAWKTVDRQLARLLDALDLETTTVFIVSDHGMAATELTAFPNGRLLSEGWIELNAETGRVDRRRSRALVETSGAIGHLYLGADLTAPRLAALTELKQVLATWQVDGKPVLERVVTRSEAAALGLDSANSGDLILFARPGVTLSWQSDREAEPVDRLGMHGYLNHHPEMYGIFLAVGAGVDVASPGRVPSSALAPRVRERLGLDGSSLSGRTRRPGG